MIGSKTCILRPFPLGILPRSKDITTDCLSRHGTTSGNLVICILDLCAGMGIVLRALWHLLPTTCPIQVDYIAVEMDPSASSVIRRVFADVNLGRPGMFLETDRFRCGNDVHHLAHRRKLPKTGQLITGVPCQLFSTANNSCDYPSHGLRDLRELFTFVHQIYERANHPNYIIECTPFAAHLQQDFQDIFLLFGEPTLHDLAKHFPHKRIRYCWTSLPTRGQLLDKANVPLSWQECLLEGSRVPTDASHMPLLKCPTLMAASHSHSDRSKSSWMYDISGTLCPLNINEKERLVGMELNDTAAERVTETASHRMCGNTFPIAWIASLLDTYLEHHSGTLRLLACRNLDKTMCVLTSPSKNAIELTDPTSMSMLHRLRNVAQQDPTYQAMLQNPQDILRVFDGLLFQACQPNKLSNYQGPIVVCIPTNCYAG